MDTKEKRPAMPKQIQGEVSLVIQNKDMESLPNCKEKFPKSRIPGVKTVGEILDEEPAFRFLLNRLKQK
jgi:hypothetical protein